MRKYIEFLKYSLNPSLSYTTEFQNIDWDAMLAWAESQAIVGIIYQGILRTGKNLTIPFDVLMKWIGYAQQISVKNNVINRKCVDVVREYSNNKFNCLILKGQGNSLYYPKPLYRTPGDIDILILSVANRNDITQYVLKGKQVTGQHFHHIEYNEDGIQIEIHYFACSQNNPISMRRLNRWLDERANPINITLPDVEGTIPVPSWEYNVIYQLAHLMHHFFDEGIGLRQFVDYYYVLNKFRDESLEFRDSAKSIELEETLKYLGLWKFAGAVMYVMCEVFALEEQYMIAPVDEKRGKTLLNEILKGGNFGKYSGLTQHSTGGKYFLKHWRNLHFVREYPSEALCEPFFRTWHFFWRLTHR